MAIQISEIYKLRFGRSITLSLLKLRIINPLPLLKRYIFYGQVRIAKSYGSREYVKTSTSLTDYSTKIRTNFHKYNANIHANFSDTRAQRTIAFYLHQTAAAKGP